MHVGKTPTMRKLNSIRKAMKPNVINNYYCKLHHLISTDNNGKYLFIEQSFSWDTLIDPTTLNKIKKLSLLITFTFI